MAGLALLDGTAAAIDTVITLTGGTVTVRCWATYLSVDLTRAMLDRTTFCTSGWTDVFPSLRSAQGRIEGFANKGLSISDPMAWFTDQTARSVTFSADNSCTMTGNAFCASDHTGLRAAANSERGISFVNSGPWSSAWVVT